MDIFYLSAFMSGLFVGIVLEKVLELVLKARPEIDQSKKTSAVGFCGYLAARLIELPERSNIAIRAVLLEVITGVVYLLVYIRFGFDIQSFFVFLFVSILMLVFFIDYEWMIIPNCLVLCLLAVAMTKVYTDHILFMAPDGAYMLLNRFLGMIVGSGFFCFSAFIGDLFFRGKDTIGGGDIKLMAPVGICLGLEKTVASLILAITMAGIAGSLLILSSAENRHRKIPFGPFIVSGSIIALLL